MPFGLTNAPAVFQRLMQNVVCPLNPTTGRDFVSVYLDDILVFSRTLEDHLMHLHTVIHRLKEVGLKLKPTKCRFVQHELEYLGHIVSREGLKTNPRLVTAVQDFPLPRTVRDIKRFIGLASYYRRFILNFARLARPLHLLTRKGVIFVWSCRCNEAFSALKERLTTAPVLAYPDFTRDFVLETDASIQGLGAVLGQHQNDQKVHPVAFASRALSNAEQRYAVTELETLAVVWSICHFHYLYGNVVTVFTDHTAVKAVLETPNPSAKHARWWSRVYGRGVKEVKIVYRPGHENRNADALSRHPQLPAPSVGIGEDEVQVFPISAEGRKDCVEVTVEQEQANDSLHGGPDALEVATTDTVTVETGLRRVGGPEITRSPKQLASVGLENAHSTLAGDTTVHQGGEAVATLSEVRTTLIRPELQRMEKCCLQSLEMILREIIATGMKCSPSILPPTLPIGISPLRGLSESIADGTADAVATQASNRAEVEVPTIHTLVPQEELRTQSVGGRGLGTEATGLSSQADIEDQTLVTSTRTLDSVESPNRNDTTRTAGHSPSVTDISEHGTAGDEEGKVSVRETQNNSQIPKDDAEEEFLALSSNLVLDVSTVGLPATDVGEVLQILFNAEPAQGTYSRDNEPHYPDHFGTEQRGDSEIREILKYVENGKLPEDDVRARRLVLEGTLFTVTDGILYYLDPKHNHRKRTVVPNQLRKQILRETHSSRFGGHFSGPRLYSALALHWWWRGMFKDATAFAKSCPECAIVMGTGRRFKPPLQPIPVSRPFQILGIDVMDLPLTERGNKHVVVVQDLFTKWPFAFAVPDQKTERIARLLAEEVIPWFGVPESLLSDRGTNLLSHLMTDLCRMLGVQKLNTTAYHPQCDGAVERFNRTLKTILRKHAARFGSQWDQYLHGVLWAYWNMPHSSTGEEPSFLLYGFDCRSPTEAAYLPGNEVNPTDVSDYREELMTSLTSAREIAAKTIQRAQVRYKNSMIAKPSSRTSSSEIGYSCAFPKRKRGDGASCLDPGMGRISSLRSLTQMLSVPRSIFPKMAHYAFTSHESVSVHGNFPQDTIGMGGNGGDLAVHRGG